MNRQKLYSGKTKDVYRLDDGKLLFYFKDEVTGEDGIVDPGANTVMGRVAGKGRISLEMTGYFFRLLAGHGIPTHLVSLDPQQRTMTVRAAERPGSFTASGGGLEFICRLLAWGSFVRRYEDYLRGPGQTLDRLVEITLKDDRRGDPLVNDDTLVALGILDRARLREAKRLTRRIAALISADLRRQRLQLIDLKVEFGLVKGEVTLIDEISADSMRVMDENRRVLSHEELYRRLSDPAR